MTATYAKPAKVPRWADSGSITEPSEGKKDSGWIYDDIPPSAYENWIQNLTGNWFKWLDERLQDGTGGTPKDDFVLYHPGVGDKGIELLVDRIDLYDPTSSDKIASFREEQLLLFDEDMEIARSASGDEHHIYMSIIAGDDFPVIAYNRANDRIAIDFDNSGGAARPDVDSNGQFEIDALGVCSIRTKAGVGTTNGAQFNLINRDRATTANRWSFRQVDDSLLLTSYTGADVKEYDYLTIDYATRLMIFDDGLKLVPATTSNGQLGGSTSRWLSAYSDNVYAQKLFEVDYGYCHSHGHADINVPASTETTITPRTEINNNDVVVDGSGLITVTRKGKYLINCNFVLEVSATGVPDVELRLYKNTVQISTAKTEVGAIVATTKFVVSYNAIVDMDIPGTDDVEIKLNNPPGGGVWDVHDSSIMTVTQLNGDE